MTRLKAICCSNGPRDLSPLAVSRQVSLRKLRRSKHQDGILQGKRPELCHQAGADPREDPRWQRTLRLPVAEGGHCQAMKLAELLELFQKRPYLQKEDTLSEFSEKCCKAIMKGEADEAQNGLDILTMQLDSEEKMIAAAFNKFDTDGSGKLAGSEVQFMLDYLGFPDSQDDVAKITKVLDWDGDGCVSFDEFLHYVGKLGGSSKLFEERSDFTGSAHDPERLRILLQESGISPEAQAHWRLTASESELDSAAAMRPCQQAAIRHIRHLAEENHIRALPQLQERVKKLGYTDTDLHMVLAWIRELAPIIVHINLDKVGKFFVEDNRREIKTPWCPYKPLVYVPRVLDGAKSVASPMLGALSLRKSLPSCQDSHYRNQFETNTSGGLLKTSAREKWERGLFGTAYDGAHAFERPKYGVQNIWNDHRGVVGAKQYGDSYIVLKDVRLRCTLSPQDSANLPARRLAVLDYYAHVLLEYSDKEHLPSLVELKETIRVAEKGDEKADWVKSICKKNGWKLKWMDEMKTHLTSREGGVELDMKAWQEKLIKLSRASTEALDKPTGPSKAGSLFEDVGVAKN
eukprot:g11016.t1